MAKKKKTASRRKAPAEKAPQERSAFWAYAGATLLIVLAVFLLLGGFGTGGPLPIGMFSGVYMALGYAAYLSPLALIFLGVHKFKNEDRKIPLGKLFSMLALVLVVASLMHTLFVNVDDFGITEGGNGGAAGGAVGGLVMEALDKIPASILFAVMSLMTFFLAFNISPKVLARPFQRPEQEEDTDLEALKTKSESQFKINQPEATEAPTPVESKPPLRLGSLRNTAQKMAANENH